MFLREDLSTDAKILNFKILESALYLKSVSIPLNVFLFLLVYSEFNPCLEGTASCASRANFGCIYQGNSQYKCDCLDGYTDNNNVCEGK